MPRDGSLLTQGLDANGDGIGLGRFQGDQRARSRVFLIRLETRSNAASARSSAVALPRRRTGMRRTGSRAELPG
jgi:hypothetical protein